MENNALLDYTKLSNGAEVVKPSSMAVSEFHFLLLIGNKVKVCCDKHSCYILTADGVHWQCYEFSYIYPGNGFSHEYETF